MPPAELKRLLRTEWGFLPSESLSCSRVDSGQSRRSMQGCRRKNNKTIGLMDMDFYPKGQSSREHPAQRLSLLIQESSLSHLLPPFGAVPSACLSNVIPVVMEGVLLSHRRSEESSKAIPPLMFRCVLIYRSI